MKTRARWLSAAALTVMVSVPALADSQQRPSGRTELEARVWAQFGRVVQNRLGLSEAGAAELNEVLRTYRERRESLALREMQLRRRVLAQGVLLGGDSAPPLSDEEARELLAEMGSIRNEEQQLVEAEMEELLEVLTPSQLVRLYALRDALGERARGLRQGGPGRGAGRVPGGLPGPPSH